MGRKNPTAIVGCGVVLALLPMAAWAQTEPLLPVPAIPWAPNVPVAPNVPLQAGATVVDRPRPELDALGIQAGPWFFYPRMEVDEAYNDNIFAVPSSLGKASDWITALAPSFDLKSNFPTNALNLSAGAIVSEYAQHSNFDTQDAFATADGRLDVDNVHDFHGTIHIARSHLDPGSPLIPGFATGPVQYSTYNATAGFEQTRLRVNYSADLAVTRTEYESAIGTNGVVLPESGLNNNTYEATLQTSYEFITNFRGFVRGAYNIQRYDHETLVGPGLTFAPRPDSQGYRVDAGVRVNLTGVTYAEIYAGYLWQDYSASQYGTVSGIDAGANVVWNPTTLTSVTLKGERTVEDVAAQVIGAAVSPALLHSSAGLSVDHELLRNVLLNANASYFNDQYQGINQTNNDYTLGAGAKYLLNRHLYLGATYTYQRQLTSGNGAFGIFPFSRNIFMLRLSTQY